MRINLKSAAASAATAFLLLFVFSLTWPGHGIWLLVIGILTGLIAAYLWRRDRFLLDQDPYTPTNTSAFTNVGAYGLAGPQIEMSRQPVVGLPLAGLLAPVSALAILLFVGGAIGSAESTVQEATTSLDQSVSAIDRSRDGEPTTPLVDPPSTSQAQQTSTTVTSVARPQNSTASPQASTESQQSAAPVKPIVVAAPKAASPAEDASQEVDLTPEAANTFEHVVEEGDTLYEIAVRYDSSVEAIMNLNQLDSFSFIHPGDVLQIPLSDGEAEES